MSVLVLHQRQGQGVGQGRGAQEGTQRLRLYELTRLAAEGDIQTQNKPGFPFHSEGKRQVDPPALRTATLEQGLPSAETVLH